MGTKNGDSPAQAQPIARAQDGCLYSTQEYDPAVKGFTKREEMAMRFAAALIDDLEEHSFNEVARKANKLADVMLKSWENNNG